MFTLIKELLLANLHPQDSLNSWFCPSSSLEHNLLISWSLLANILAFSPTLASSKHGITGRLQFCLFPTVKSAQHQKAQKFLLQGSLKLFHTCYQACRLDHTHILTLALYAFTANPFLISFDFSLYLHWLGGILFSYHNPITLFSFFSFFFSFFGKQRIWIKSRTQKSSISPISAVSSQASLPLTCMLRKVSYQLQLHFHDVSPFWPLVTLSPLQWN